jgi:hypothetical protein
LREIALGRRDEGSGRQHAAILTPVSP